MNGVTLSTDRPIAVDQSARDNLTRCISINYDIAGERMRLSCALTAQEAGQLKGDVG